MSDKIKIVVNGFQEEVPPGSSIEFLIKHLNELDPHLIAELNGRFVYPNQYSTSTVKENDRVEFINPNLGG
jgi:thiamine biosynthesis protein ThiS